MAGWRQVSVLFTDVEASTRLWEEHPGVMAGVLAGHDRVLRESIGAHGGWVFSTAGDSFAAAFPSVGAAVEAAVAAQRRMGGWSVAGSPVRVRMAVHCGEVEERDGGLFGPALNRAARLRDAGHGGQVLVSEEAVALLGDGLPEGVSLGDLGVHRLRDLSRPRRVFQLCHADLEDGFPPLRSLGASNLPVQVTSFVGRAAESVELEKLIRGSRLVTITGAGGCGKSRLAVQVAAGMSGEFPDGVWLVELAPLGDADLLAATVAAAVGVQPQPGRSMVEWLVGFLRTRSLLLVVDNCEHLIDAAAGLVGHVLSRTPEVRMVATSREPLHVQGETVFHLDPLPVGGVNGEFDVLFRSDGVRLFAERAEAANPRFRFSRDNAAVVAGICTRLDGIPLGLELAASACRLLTLDQIDRRLGDRFGLLTGETRGGLDHHRTLEAAIDWSYGLLDADQQALFERLAVFAGPFSVEAAEAVGHGGDILKGIVELADRSLLEIEETPLGVRYRMLETIRAFAATRLEERPEELQDRLRERHYRFFLTLAEQAAEGPISADHPPQWLPQLDAATPDLRRALAWAIDSGHDQHAVDLAGALGRYWGLRRRWEEADRWYRSAPLHSATIDIRPRARALRWAAEHISLRAADETDMLTARELAEESLRLARSSGDPDLIAASLMAVGSIAFDTGDPYITRVLEEALTSARQAGNTWREILIRTILAHHLHDSGRIMCDSQRVEEAVALWTKNLEAARALGDDYTVAMTLGFLSWAAWWCQGPDEAYRLATESLKIARKLADRGLAGPLSNALYSLGAASYLKGDYDTARTCHQEVFDLSLTLGKECGEELLELGMIAHARGDNASARHHLHRALSLLPRLDAGWGAHYLRRALWGLGRVLTRENDLNHAAVIFAAVEAADHVPPPWIDQKQEPADHRQCAHLIERGLTTAELAEAQQRGRAMTLDQAVDYALTLLDGTPASEDGDLSTEALRDP